jgi:uncharacterized protein (DUF1330 family)
MPFGYVIAQINITDPEAYQVYVGRVNATLAPFQGSFLVRGGTAEHFEGTPAGQRFVVIQFPTLQNAHDWYGSDEYAPVKRLRQAASVSVQTIVQGI